MSFIPISQARFEALTYAKQPIITLFTDEKEWYSDPRSILIGVVIFDRTDSDWNWIVLGRDQNGLFRAIATECSIEDLAAARAGLHHKMEELLSAGQTVHPQEPISKKLSILEPIVAPEKLNPNFKALIELNGYSPAREIMQEIANAFVDIDGNYVKDFQTTGFSARLWELYLFAFLHEQQFSINREFDRPDYCAIKFGFPLCIEACTVNSTKGDNPASPKTGEEAHRLNKDFMPIKYGSPLYSKMKMKYWELGHVKGLPFSLAIHDFHNDDSMVWSGGAIDEYLYGTRATSNKDKDGILHITETPIEEHVWGDKRIPSGFFKQLDAENVSAVIFSNAGTIAKFNRMGKLAGFGDPRIKMFRKGGLQDPDPNADKPKLFCVEVSPDNYNETWSDSIRVFHNPRASIPLPPDVLTGCNHFFLEGGQRVAYLLDNFVHWSRTFVIAPQLDSTSSENHNHSELTV